MDVPCLRRMEVCAAASNFRAQRTSLVCRGEYGKMRMELGSFPVLGAGMTKCATCLSAQPTRRSKKWRSAYAFWVSAVEVARRQQFHHCYSDRKEYRRRHKLLEQTNIIHRIQDHLDFDLIKTNFTLVYL